MIVRHQNPSSSCWGVCDDEASELEPVQPSLHALAMALDEPRDLLVVAVAAQPCANVLVAAHLGDVAPAHDRRQAHDQLCDRAAVARGAGAAGPLLPSPPPPKVREHGDQRCLQPRVPVVRSPALGAGELDRRQDLDARWLRWRGGGEANARRDAALGPRRAVLGAVNATANAARSGARGSTHPASLGVRQASAHRPRCGSVRTGGKLWDQQLNFSWSVVRARHGSAIEDRLATHLRPSSSSVVVVKSRYAPATAATRASPGIG